jgi:hypothetical protein
MIIRLGRRALAIIIGRRTFFGTPDLRKYLFKAFIKFLGGGFPMAFLKAQLSRPDFPPIG